jgi:hypothetical protein
VRGGREGGSGAGLGRDVEAVGTGSVVVDDDLRSLALTATPITSRTHSAAERLSPAANTRTRLHNSESKRSVNAIVSATHQRYHRYQTRLVPLVPQIPRPFGTKDTRRTKTRWYQRHQQ